MDGFARFTDQARASFTLAQDEAQRFRHPYIGTEHLILGLLRVDDCVATRVLRNLGAEPSKVRTAVSSSSSGGVTGRSSATWVSHPAPSG